MCINNLFAAKRLVEQPAILFGTLGRETLCAKDVEALLFAFELHVAAIPAQLVHTAVPMEIGFAVVEERHFHLERVWRLVVNMREHPPPIPHRQGHHGRSQARDPINQQTLVFRDEVTIDTIGRLQIQHPGFAAVPTSEPPEEIHPTVHLLRDGFGAVLDGLGGDFLRRHRRRKATLPRRRPQAGMRGAAKHECGHGENAPSRAPQSAAKTQNKTEKTRNKTIPILRIICGLDK